jgi:hypothetical protein
MKQTINPRVATMVVVAGVILLACIGMWIWTRPTATPAAASAGADSRAAIRATDAKERAEAHRTSAQERRELEELQKNNPGATTRVR